MSSNPELGAEQAYIDRAYACVEQLREFALSVVGDQNVTRGGTFQSQYEREIMWERMSTRASQLELGSQPLCFGRLDYEPSARGLPTELAADLEDAPTGSLAPIGETRFYIGRMSVADDRQTPLVVDWRAPVSEPFYRATGPDPQGLRRRRQFVVRGRELLGLDDEFFGEAAEQLDDGEISGQGALIAALQQSRSGKLSDIVATIQGEQDEIIRSPLPGPLIVQGGPGTGKTVVALHRAAYLLYTHRFPLQDQGVLVLGPNRLFLNYIDQVLPSLGEAGVEIAVIGDLVYDCHITRWDPPDAAAVKGDLRMLRVLKKAVRDRERALRTPLRVPFGLETLTLGVERSADIIDAVRRRVRSHNAGRRHVEELFFDALAGSSRRGITAQTLRDRIRRRDDVREALERMWPVLTPGEFLNDLFGAPALLKSACGPVLTEDERKLLERPRSADVGDIYWSHQDAPLLDEARELLGTHPKYKGADRFRTYGHIVVDEAQDLSPMELRCVRRRSLNGSMTLVGDIAQATTPWAIRSWDELASQLPGKKTPRIEYLATGYRVPGPIMDLASRVLAAVSPALVPPRSVRGVGDPPIVEGVVPSELGEFVVAAAQRELEAVGHGNVAIICASSMLGAVEDALISAGVEFGRATRHGLDLPLTVVPVALAKGLELDSVIVVEPDEILFAGDRGAQALYVAFTRCTQRLSVLHTRARRRFLFDD